MPTYNYPSPKSPGYKKPTCVEDCLPQARIHAKKQHGRTAMGPVKKGDNILLVTFPDQDKYAQEALTQALKEEGAAKVVFITNDELAGKTSEKTSVEDGWKESERMESAPWKVAGGKTPSPALKGLYQYLVNHPEFTTVLFGLGGRHHQKFNLRDQGHKFKNNYIFSNWEEFLSRSWLFPEELTIEMERKILEPIGQASEIRITDPEGTHLEYSLTAEQAVRWQRGAWMSGHLFMDPFQATCEECSVVPVSTKVPPVFLNINGVLAGTANHVGFFPRMEIYIERGRLEKVKGGGKYGEIIRELVDKYKNIHWPGYPDKGIFWFCDSVVCTQVKSFRRTSDMFDSYWHFPNAPERNRAGVFHHGFGSRMHGPEYQKYADEHKLPTGHIHVHNYFVTFEIKLRGTNTWYKIIDKGRVSAMDDPELRAIAVKFGDPDDLLNYDWIPPLPGINCSGDYFQDYAPNPVAYLKLRKEENQSI